MSCLTNSLTPKEIQSIIRGLRRPENIHMWAVNQWLFWQMCLSNWLIVSGLLWIIQIFLLAKRYFRSFFSSTVVFFVSSFLKEDYFLQNLWGRSDMWQCWIHFNIAMETCSPQRYCFLLWSVIFCGWPASLLLWVSNTQCLCLYVPTIKSNLWFNVVCVFFSRRNNEHNPRAVVCPLYCYLSSCLHHLHIFRGSLLCCIYWYHPAVLHLCQPGEKQRKRRGRGNKVMSDRNDWWMDGWIDGRPQK